MPQTVCSGTMFTTPSGFSPHLACAEPEEEEEAPQEGPGPGACLADGPSITSASLDTLIQNLIPTADYYPEVSVNALHSLRCSLQTPSIILFFMVVMTELPIRLLVPCLCLKCYSASVNYRKPQCFFIDVVAVS